MNKYDLPPLPEPLEIDWPELHSEALGCGVEDRGIHDRYEAAEYGWQDGVDKAADRVPDQIYDAEQMQAYATAAIEADRKAPDDTVLTCDSCGMICQNPWHTSHGENRHVHLCDACYEAIDRARRIEGDL